ncbi:MAG: GDP-L-fucose synthase [Calditrichia bacterium]
MEKRAKIFVAGHRGMVGSALVRRLRMLGYNNFVVRDRHELNLLDQQGVASFFREERPEIVFLAAAKVGGIQANNNFRGQFLYENLQIQNNIIHSAYITGTRKLLFLGSSCIYPKFADQPIREDSLLTGALEPTNEPYAIAKIAGIKMCQAYNMQYGSNFISVMPTNLFGENDNFDYENSHVLPALLRKFHEAKVENKPSVEIWGSGTPRREFLHVDDLAAACCFLMESYNDAEIVNIGTGVDISIRELAELIKDITGFEGELTFNTSKPDGTPRKLLDVSRLRGLGWQHSISLREGIESTYKWFVEQLENEELTNLKL